MTKALAAGVIVAFVFGASTQVASAAPAAAHFLPHPKGMTLTQKIAYFSRSLARERMVHDWLDSRAAPRTAERLRLLRWYGHAVTWHAHLLVRYKAKLPPPSPREYARQLAAAQGWTGSEWTDLDIIVSRESGWNPCRHYPSTTDCYYAGGNACGIPQRNPCPESWRGRLGSSWREQVVELIRYVRTRYGTPGYALSIWNVQQSY